MRWYNVFNCVVLVVGGEVEEIFLGIVVFDFVECIGIVIFVV